MVAELAQRRRGIANVVVQYKPQRTTKGDVRHVRSVVDLGHTPTQQRQCCANADSVLQTPAKHQAGRMHAARIVDLRHTVATNITVRKCQSTVKHDLLPKMTCLSCLTVFPEGGSKSLIWFANTEGKCFNASANTGRQLFYVSTDSGSTRANPVCANSDNNCLYASAKTGSNMSY